MAIPARGLESAWRNDINDVSAMLRRYHNGHYMIWNLSDTEYDYQKFDDNVRLALGIGRRGFDRGAPIIGSGVRLS